MKVLYIGGSGQISFDCIHETVKAGHETWVFNRGNNNHGLPEKTNFIRGDLTDDANYAKLADMHFDAICQFRAFSPDHLERDIRLFSGKTSQYLFISTASAYQKPARTYTITEEVPLENPFWEYSRKKIECEKMLQQQDKLPYTILRPSHTSRTKFTSAMGEGEVAPQRMLKGKPVVIPGDGSSLWTITYSKDFAPPFVRLLGNPRAINDYFHLTSDNAYEWNVIYKAIGKSVGVEPRIVHVPSDTLVKYNPDWTGPLFGDKAYSVTFDNSKIKSVVGEFDCNTSLDKFMSIVADTFFAGEGDKREINPGINQLFDKIAMEQLALGK
jgi:nucleoside-diphosphate-sugar epimerase